MPLRDTRSHSRVVLSTAAAVLSVSIFSPALAFAQQPTAPAPAARPATHTVKRGDTLWDIAKLYLGDPFLWPEIYRINTDQIEDPHWIYPGEVLKLPGDQPKAVAAAPSEPAPAVVTPVVPAPITPPALKEPADSTPIIPPAPPAPTIRMGEYIAAPWVEQRGGPRGAGYVIGSRNLPGISSANQSRLNLYDPVNIAPPVGAVAPEHELYLTYRKGPLIEDLGQIIIPTGVIEVTRSARNGEAAIGRVVKLFNEMLQGQELIALDSMPAVLSGAPSAVANGKTGKVRWIYNTPVLPSMQSYVVLDISRRDVAPGDQIELYLPRQKPTEGRDLALPEVHIARGQVLRVTPFGATVVLTHQDQPKIEEGTAARVAAKMP